MNTQAGLCLHAWLDFLALNPISKTYLELCSLIFGRLLGDDMQAMYFKNLTVTKLNFGSQIVCQISKHLMP